ncbi:PREDICTED: RNA polymerase-associated protein CTR9 homolog [Fragaria vesca subsp. vesca]
MASVYIPVQNSEEEVRVALDQLPRDASDILDILKAEQAPLDLWLIIAREYFKQGKLEQFRQILEEGSSPEIDEYYADVRYERIAILNALGAYYSYLGKIETKQREKEEHFILATQFYNKASRIDIHEPSTWVGKGQLLLAKGEVDQAFNAFKIVLDGDRDNVPSLLGQACVEFNRGQFSDSLELYKRALQVNPDCPAAVRLGIGLCRYKMGQFEKAWQAFHRVLELDPENVEALVALAILDLHTNAAAGIRKGMEKMQRAFELYPYCAMALNYLANHFFYTGQHFLVEQLTETALAVTNHGPTKSHSYYNLARSYHSKGDYDKAGVYYMASVKEISKPQEFIFPYYVNLARLLEQLHNTETAAIFYRLILFKYPDYVDAYLRLAALAKARNNLQLSIELVNDALKVNNKSPNALLMLGDLELKNDDWVKAKETFRAASEATEGKDSYATLSLGNWNYFAAIRNEKRNPKLEATHLEKSKELYTKVLAQHSANLYAANGAGVVFAEKGHFDVSKDIFTQVQEAASGNIFVQMPDVWINLAHVYFAQGNFPLAVKMYQNCLRKFFNNTDSQILLYIARTQYEAEQWQDCKKTLMRAIHLAPSNYTLRFDAGVVMQKFSASTLQKSKKSVDEVRSTVAELENAVRLFKQLSAASSLHFHGFDEKKIDTHVEYCSHLLEAARVHLTAAEHEEQKIRQKQELARQMAIAEEARRKAEEQRKFQLERRMQEDELKRVKQQEEHFERIKEQWKSSTSGSKRRPSDIIDDEGGHSEKRRRKGGKKRRKDKHSRSRYETEEAEAEQMDYQEAPENEDADTHYRESGHMNEQDDEENAQNPLEAVGLEDSDVEDEAAPAGRRRRAWSESDDDEEQQERQPESSPRRENSADVQSDGEGDKPNGDLDDEE